MPLDKIQVLNASAGTGKTTALTDRLTGLLNPDQEGAVSPENVMITTFTEKAAAEIKERVRSELLKQGFNEEARRIERALIGTVHHIGNRLSEEYAFDLGIAPHKEIIPEEDAGELFNRAVERVVNDDLFQEMEGITRRMGVQDQDWSKELNELVGRARANGLDDSSIRQCGEKSARELTECLPELQQSQDPSGELQRLIEALLQEIRESNDETREIRKGASHLERIHRSLENEQELPWKEWVDLQSIQVSKAFRKSSEHIQDLEAFAADHIAQRAFQDDLSQYVRKLFGTAADVMASYSEIKEEQGLLDYTDMEVQLLEVFENKWLQDDLKGRIELLMVDEFQDSSPLQIKVFLKAAEYADHAIWVGDPKQSIYGFRGTDPELMETVLDQAPNRESLETNFRTRPSLNRLVGQLFKGQFSFRNGSEVEVNSHRTEEDLGIPLQFWRTDHPDGGNKPPTQDQKPKAIAEGVRMLLQEPRKHQVHDKTSDELRPIRAGDIAILCRGNAKVEKVSSALEEAGISSASPSPGLLQTAEGVLFQAALRYLSDPRDRLAIMEMKLLAKGDGEVGPLLNERLTYVKENQEVQDDWGQNAPFVEAIDREREQLRQASVSKVASKLVSSLDLMAYLTHWGKVEQRKANVDELLRIVKDFEGSCRRMKKASTLTGLLIHLEELKDNGEDMIAAFQGGDAVRVDTYHKAKGLEWPVVMLYELDRSMKEDPKKQLFNSFISGSSDGGMDLQNPLKDRYLSYWPFPYGANKNLPEEVQGRIQDHIDRAYKRWLEEEKRLLYVGFTRARDRLIIPYYEGTLSRDKAERFWVAQNLGVIWQDHVPETPGTFDLSLGDTSTPIQAELIEIPVPEELEREVEENHKTFPMPEGVQEHPPLRVVPSQTEKEDAPVTVRPLTDKPIHSRLAKENSLSKNDFGNAFHRIMAIGPEEYLTSKGRNKILDILKEYGFDNLNDKIGLLVENLRKFEEFLQEQWTIEESYREWPLFMWKNGQLYHGYADLVLKTPDGYVLIDHKSFPGKKKEALEQAKNYSNQLKTYRDILEAATSYSVVGNYIYFGVTGWLVEVAFDS